MAFQLQVLLPVEYKGIQLDCGYRIDLLVDNQLIVELKAVDQMALIVTLRNASSELIQARSASEGCATACDDSLACASGLYNKLTIKADQIKGIHGAQLLTYMKLGRKDTGLLLNFNVEVLRDGIKRFKL